MKVALVALALVNSVDVSDGRVFRPGKIDERFRQTVRRSAPECDVSRYLEIKDSGLVYSNLGGAGPDTFAPRGVLYGDVFPNSGTTADLTVTLIDGDPTSTTRSGTAGTLGKIAFSAEKAASLTFTITDRDAPHQKSSGNTPFVFTLLDIRVPVRIAGHDDVTLDDASPLKIHKVGPLAAVVVPAATAEPQRDDIVLSQLPDDIKRRSVSILFSSESFNLTVLPNSEAKPGDDTVLTFAGATNMVCTRMPQCSEFSCPVGLAAKPEARSLQCQSNPCTANDALTCCMPALATLCEDTYRLSFQQDSLLFSNLGGLGPDRGSDKSILISDVFPSSGRPVDLRVSAVTDYSARDATKNEVVGQVLSINIRTRSSTDFLFEFLNRAGEPEVVGPFYVTLLDVDEQGNYDGKEFVEVRNMDALLTAGSSLLKNVTNTSEGVLVRVQSDSRGVYSDDPHNLRNMSPQQLARTTTIHVPRGSSFTLKLGVDGGYRGSGRNFELAGVTNSVCPQQATCASYTCPIGSTPKPGAEEMNCHGEVCGTVDTDVCCDKVMTDACEPERVLQFSANSVLRNNLGGLGPDAGNTETLVLMDVFPRSGRVIDMQVEAVGEYHGNAVNNGLKGQTSALLSINVNTADSANLTFRFVSRDSQQEVAMGQFYFTVFNLFQEKDGEGRTGVNVSGSTASFLTPSSAIQLENSVHMSSGVGSHGEAEIPVQVRNLTQWQMDHSVTYLMDNVSSFNVFLRASKGTAETHNFLMAGASSMTCPRATLCSTMRCPFGYARRPETANLTCGDVACSHEDVPFCCAKVEIGECAAAQTLSWEESDVVHSNLAGLGPDMGDPRQIIIENVFPASSKAIDLVVEVANTTSQDRIISSWVRHSIGYLNMRANTSVDVRFTFMNRESKTTLPPGKFFFSFLALDQESTGDGVIKVATVPAALAYEVSPDSIVEVQGNTFQVATANTSTKVPTSTSMHPRALSDIQTKSTATVLVAQQESFDVTLACYSIQENQCEFFYGGASNLVCPTRATCNTFQCPPDYLKKSAANYLACSTDKCSQDDIHTCCLAVAKGPCADDRAFSVESASVFWSNLGGVGPDVDKPPGLRIGNVFPRIGSTIDVDISVNTSLSQYTPHDAGVNGLHGKFLYINLESGSSADFTFRFIDRLTQEPTRVPTFYMSAFDVSTFVNGMDSKTITMVYPEQSTVQVAEDSVIVIRDDGATLWSGSTFHNPEKAGEIPESLSQLDLKQAATWLVPATAEVKMRLELSNGFAGRNFLFGGRSNIVCATPATCDTYTCPKQVGLANKADAASLTCKGDRCTAADDDVCCDVVAGPGRDFLDLRYENLIHANLLGQGPDKEAAKSILIGNVFPTAERTVDLEIVALNNFSAPNPREHGVMKTLPIGAVAVENCQKAELKYTYIDREKGQPVEMGPVYFSWLNFYGPHVPFVRSVLTVDPLESFAPISGTHIHQGDNNSFVADASAGATLTEHTSPMRLSESEMDNVVTMTLASTSSFSVRFDSMCASDHDAIVQRKRVFYFAGATNSVVPAKDICANFSCPSGFKSVEARAASTCASSTCSDVDIPLCCAVAELTAACHDERLLFLHNLSFSNLAGHGPDLSYPSKLVFRNVFPHSDQNINLEVRVVKQKKEYIPVKPSLNGLNAEHAGAISLGAQKRAFLRFNFVVNTFDAWKFPFCPVGVLRESHWTGLGSSGFQSVASACRLDNKAIEGVDLKCATGLGFRRPAGCPYEEPTGESTGAGKSNATGNTTSSHEHGVPVVVPAFWFSVLDFDSDQQTREQLRFHSKYYSDVRVTANTTVLHTGSGQYDSSAPTSALTKPSPLVLDTSGRDRSISFLMKPASEFDLEVAFYGKTSSSKLFQFAGATSLVCQKRAMCTADVCPIGFRVTARPGRLCAGETCSLADISTCCVKQEPDSCNPDFTLQLDQVLYSNLDHQGPNTSSPTGIRFANVFRGVSSTPVDMEIQAVTEYSSPMPEHNNATPGGLFRLNVASGTATALKVTFKDPVADCIVGAPVSFFFTIFDLVQREGGKGSQYAGISDHAKYSYYVLSPDTLLHTSTFSDGLKTYTSFESSGKTDIRDWKIEDISPMSLPKQDRRRAVAFLFPKDIEMFQMKVGVTEDTGENGSSFYFGGASSVSCPSLPSCLEFKCSVGYMRRPMAGKLACHSDPCTEGDHPTCCVAMAES